MGKRKFRLAVVQMTVTPEVEENLKRIARWIERAAKQGADFVLFPEYSLTGSKVRHPQDLIDDALDRIAEACRQNKITALVGTTYQTPAGRENQVRIYTQSGDLLGVQTKIVCTIKDREEKEFICGKELRTYKHRGLHFGVLACNDLWVSPGCGPYPDPRLSYRLGQKGVDVIFHAVGAASAANYLKFHEGNHIVRAMESGAYIAVANIAGPAREACVTVGVIDPEGEFLVKAPHGRDRMVTTDIVISNKPRK